MPVAEKIMLVFLFVGLLWATILRKYLNVIGSGEKRTHRRGPGYTKVLKKILKRERKISGVVGVSHAITPRKQADKKLRQLVQAVETMQLGVTITNIEGEILYTNLAEARMHGYTVEELVGKDLGIFAPAELRQPMSVEQIAQMEHLRESVNIRKNGTIFPVKLMSDIVKDGAGQPLAIVTTCEDITEHKRTERKLQEHARELTLLNQMSVLLQACDSEEETYKVIMGICKKLFPADAGCLCILNPTKAAMEVVDFWGEPPHTAACVTSASSSLSQDSDSHLNCEDFGVLCPHQIYCPYYECLSAPIVASGEILGLLSLCFVQHEPDKLDDEHDEHVASKQVVLNRIVEHYALLLTNLRLREKLKIEAIRDPLTGLYNRRYMKDALEREARRAERRNTSVGIIMLDIDHFKNFNDNYGHKVGDVVLRELGAFLLKHVRGEDIACRYGGEEFLVILPEATLETATQRAEELRLGVKQLRAAFRAKSFQITASFGVAAFPDRGTEIMHALYQADDALYQAKSRGRDQVVIATS